MAGMTRAQSYAIGAVALSSAALAGLAIARRASKECPEGYYYDTVEQVCKPIIPPPSACTVDADCPTGQVCQDGQCVVAPPPSACTVDADCPTGQVCQDGQCVVAPPLPPPNPKIYGTLQDTQGNPIPGTVYIGAAPVLPARAHHYDENSFGTAFIVPGDHAWRFTAGDILVVYGAQAGRYTVSKTPGYVSGSEQTVIPVSESVTDEDRYSSMITKEPDYTTIPFGETGYYEKAVAPLRDYYVWAVAPGYTGGEFPGLISSVDAVSVTNAPVEVHLVGIPQPSMKLQVYDYVTGEPIPLVTVELPEYGTSGTTNTEGRIDFTDLPGDETTEHRVTFTKDGYTDRSLLLTTGCYSVGNCQVQQIWLKPAVHTADLSVSVTYEGSVVYQAYVSVYSGDNLVKKILTSGTATFTDLPLGLYTVVAEPVSVYSDQYDTVSTTYQVADGEYGMTITLPKKRAATTVIQVNDTNGSPVPGVSVTLRKGVLNTSGTPYYEYPEVTKTGTTASDGTVTFNDLEGSKYEITLSKDGYIGARYYGLIPHDGEIHLTIEHIDTDLMEVGDPYTYSGKPGVPLRYWDHTYEMVREETIWLENIGHWAYYDRYLTGNINYTQYHSIWGQMDNYCTTYGLEGCTSGTERCQDGDLICGEWRNPSCGLSIDKVVEQNSQSCVTCVSDADCPWPKVCDPSVGCVDSIYAIVLLKDRAGVNPVPNVAVKIGVTNDPQYYQSAVTDADGKAWFRGLPSVNLINYTDGPDYNMTFTANSTTPVTVRWYK